MSHLISTLDGHVGTIRFDRPEKRNALTKATLRAMPEAVETLVDGGARTIILAGADNVFTGGADLDEFSYTEADIEVEDGLAGAADALADAPVPTIAAIEGACLGAGVELVLACDVRVAGKGAFFMIPATRLGILYRPDGLSRILHQVGPETTSRLFLLNERLAPECLCGVIVPDGSAYHRAVSLAEHASTLVAESVSATKTLIRELVAGETADTDWDAVRRRLLRDR